MKTTIHTIQNDEVAFIEALYAVVQALDNKFPNGNNIYQRISRLCEESGELAAAVNHIEGMGIKKQKHGEADKRNLVKELQDVMRTTLGVARHYGLEEDLRLSVQEAYRHFQKDGLIGKD
jgi:NTP pyrophosphatase (non-canonical NTP hydrolase)